MTMMVDGGASHSHTFVHQAVLDTDSHCLVQPAQESLKTDVIIALSFTVERAGAQRG